MYFMLIEVNNELLKMAIFSFVPALKGTCCVPLLLLSRIHHVVQNFNNDNLSFRKLGINSVQMRPVSPCYTSGRGRLIFLGLGHYTMSLDASGQCLSPDVSGQCLSRDVSERCLSPDGN